MATKKSTAARSGRKPLSHSIPGCKPGEPSVSFGLRLPVSIAAGIDRAEAREVLLELWAKTKRRRRDAARRRPARKSAAA